MEIAEQSQILVLPTGTSPDDPEPTNKLAHELRKEGIPYERINIALSRNSKAELEEAIDYIGQSEYHLLEDVLYEKRRYVEQATRGKVPERPASNP